MVGEGDIMGSLRVYLIIVAWVSASLIVANTVLAEGDRSTYVQGVYTGFNSNTWNDRDKDNEKTRIRFSKCRINAGGAPTSFTSVTLELRKVNDLLPDDSYGTKVLACYNSATGNWGRVREKARYKFRINLINGASCCQSMDSRPVEIWW